jgi:hypothetical protein
MREDNSGPVGTDELRAAILARDALIERIRNGEEGLIDRMYAACRRVEELPAPVSQGKAG